MICLEIFVGLFLQFLVFFKVLKQYEIVFLVQKEDKIDGKKDGKVGEFNGVNDVSKLGKKVNVKGKELEI